jgi:hypothetical protein
MGKASPARPSLATAQLYVFSISRLWPAATEREQEHPVRLESMKNQAIQNNHPYLKKRAHLMRQCIKWNFISTIHTHNFYPQRNK